MRTKTDARRRAIVSAAWDLFKANGFGRTTMSEISERVGGSKATLYGYFSSKEELFAAALEQVMRERINEAFARMEGGEELDVRLGDFGRAYLQVRLAPDMIGVDRALIGEADHSDLGEVLRVRFVTPQWREFAAALGGEMQAGALRPAEPYVAAMHFRGLIEADLVERRLHGDASITPEEIEAAVEAGVEVFLRAYSPVVG